MVETHNSLNIEQYAKEWLNLSGLISLLFKLFL